MASVDEEDGDWPEPDSSILLAWGIEKGLISEVPVQGCTPCQNAHVKNVQVLEHEHECVKKGQIC